MSDIKKLHAIDVKNEVKRIKKLPKDEQEGQMDILYNELKLDVDNHYDIVSSLDESEMNEEYIRITKALRQLKWKWRWQMAKYVSKKSDAWISSNEFYEKYGIDVNAHKKVNAAHVSGLPLPEQAKVAVWWRDNKLIFASSATEFSLPVERIMGMGTTTEFTSSDLGGSKTYFTIEYKKDDEIKSIVVWVTYKTQVRLLVRYFDEIKGTREKIKQEL